MPGLKENVIVGRHIPSGIGLRKYESIRIGPQEEFNRLVASKSEEIEA
jgi:DNA-directed RNA polymerase subunit beta'